jgi:hypothetical protein
MGAPVPEFDAAEDASAETLLSSLKSISAAERRRHATVFNYWLSIRGDKALPPIRDLDPLEISDAGPHSLLLEMIGGEDADIRHLGQAIKFGMQVEKVSDAPSPSLLSCIAGRLPIVAATKQPFAFEEEYSTEEGTTRLWVTLLPFSAGGTLIDYVYGFVSVDAPGSVEAAAEPEPEAPEFEETADLAQEQIEPVVEAAAAEVENLAEEAPREETEPQEAEPEIPEQPDAAPAAESSPGFSAQLFENLTKMTGFYGRGVDVEPSFTAEPAAAEEEPETNSTPEGPLQSKLTEVRAKAEEARAAKLRANAALYEGLSAAYDFALDAEDNAEEYLAIVQGNGLKIQLRSPMAPVVKLAFDGMCDESMIAQLEAVLSWAFEQELPRGSLAERIQAEGGIAPILNGRAKAA